MRTMHHTKLGSPGFFNGKTMALSVLCLLFIVQALAQDTLATSPERPVIKRIRYVGKFPPDIKNEERGIFDRIGDFFFGEKQVIKLGKPISVWAENPESYWVLDQGVRNLLKINGQVGEIPHSLKDEYASLVGMCASSDGNLFFTDSQAEKILRFHIPNDELTVFNPSVELNQPTGIAWNPVTNQLWVVETAAHRITVFDKYGEVVRQIGNRGEQPGEFNYPTFIWIDREGTVYIVDSMNFRIQLFDSSGQLISYFGEIGDASGYFSRPKGIATDSFGNIYVVDALFHAVQIFDRKGNLLYHFGKQGREEGQFWLPTGIYIDKNDYIYVADSYNSRVQVFQLINAQADDEENKN